MTSGIGFPLILIFAWCAIGVLSGFIIAERRIPALLAWTGSFAAGSALWAAGEALIGRGEFRSDVWTKEAITNAFGESLLI